MMVHTLVTEELCKTEIEELRKKMIHVAGQLGVSHPLVLSYSQKLDQIHNHLMLSVKKNSPYENHHN